MTFLQPLATPLRPPIQGVVVSLETLNPAPQPPNHAPPSSISIRTMLPKPCIPTLTPHPTLLRWVVLPSSRHGLPLLPFFNSIYSYSYTKVCSVIYDSGSVQPTLRLSSSYTKIYSVIYLNQVVCFHVQFARVKHCSWELEGWTRQEGGPGGSYSSHSPPPSSLSLSCRQLFLTLIPSGRFFPPSDDL